MVGNSVQQKFENKSQKYRIISVPALNLRPGMNVVAIFTPRIIFSEFKLVSFMAYTYNMNMTQLKIQDGSLTFGSVCRLINVCTSNLRPGMNSVANFAPSINLKEFKLAYTYRELDLAPVTDPMMAPIVLQYTLVIHALFIM